MKIIFLILTLLFTQLFYSQVEIQEDNLTIEYKRNNKAGLMVGMGNITNVYSKSKKLIQYRIKVRIEMIDNEKRPFDPNKFSIVDEQNKIRLRPVDIANSNYLNQWHLNRLIKNKPNYKSLEDRYKPDIKDTFLDYEFEGITNVCIPINYEAYDKFKISLKNPKTVAHESYFEPRDFRKQNLNLYFFIPVNSEITTLFYGNKKIADIKF